MRLTSLTFLVLSVNAAIDTGRYDHITLDEVEDRIDNREVIPWLIATLGDDIDLSLFDNRTINEIQSGLFDVVGAVRGRERRKCGVEKRGLCILLALVVELIQQRRWEQVKM